MNYFTLDEFKCPCCGRNEIDFVLVRRLDVARSMARIPFIVNSGYRCGRHNMEVGGSSTSSHLKGLAADIKCLNSISRYIILRALLNEGFNRIGLSERFVHVDIDSSKPSCLIWVY